MLILGAKGHAKEILEILHLNKQTENLYFYDDVTPNLPEQLYGTFPIIKNFNAAKNLLSAHAEFALGMGGGGIRKNLYEKFAAAGGKGMNVIAPNVMLGHFGVCLGRALNIMQQVFISNDVIIGTGSLLNHNVNIHHDVVVGQFCEIGPGAVLTGGVQIGDLTMIGAGALILPKVKIGKNAIIGAGSVVTKDIPDNYMAYGNPAKLQKNLSEYAKD